MLTSKAMLRITSKSLGLNEITAYLGKPTKGYSKGEPFGKRNNLREHTQWMLSSNLSDSFPLGEHIDNLVEYYKSSEHVKISNDIEIDLFCMLSSDNGQGGLLLSNKTLRNVAELGMSIVFDVYLD